MKFWYRAITTLLFIWIGYYIGHRNNVVLKSTHCNPFKLLKNRIQSLPTDSARLNGKKASEVNLFSREIDHKFNIHNEIFHEVHHPDLPSKVELFLTHSSSSKQLQECSSYFLTRTGERSTMSVKYGLSAKLWNQYQNDFVSSDNLRYEFELLPPMLNYLDELVGIVIKKLGEPVSADGDRRVALLMVANEGVMDLVLNFLCSCKKVHISLDSVVVFLGQGKLAPIIENLGAHAVYHDALGNIPTKAAENYGDTTFSRLMWLKATSIFVTARAGFDVLFQDADLVWLKNPIPYLQALKQDISFMDDGARTPRFAPFFVNSGFYFQKFNIRTQFLMERMLKSISEIGSTHSHQATLTRHITEAHHLYGLTLTVLDMELFPSGIMFHHNKNFVSRVKAKEFVPYVWHMCWTTSREEKVIYFKEMSMWHLLNQSSCTVAEKMLRESNVSKNLLEECCQI